MATFTVRSWYPLFGCSQRTPLNNHGPTNSATMRPSLSASPPGPLYHLFYAISIPPTIVVRLRNATMALKPSRDIRARTDSTDPLRLTRCLNDFSTSRATHRSSGTGCSHRVSICYPLAQRPYIGKHILVLCASGKAGNACLSSCINIVQHSTSIGYLRPSPPHEGSDPSVKVSPDVEETLGQPIR